jgi:hypothetical protein
MLHAIQTQGFYFTEIFWMDKDQALCFEFGQKSKRSIADDQTVPLFIKKVNGEDGLAHHEDPLWKERYCPLVFNLSSRWTWVVSFLLW